MPNNYFHFKQFTIYQDRTAMKVCTDACLFGAWVADLAQYLLINRVLDIGSGTGLLSLMLAQRCGAEIRAVEINSEAALQSIQNISASPWAQQITVEHIAMQDFISDEKFDLVISNPPFYEDDLRSADPHKNAAKHDTSLRLEELLRSIKKYIKIDGQAAILLPFHRCAFFQKRAEEQGLFVTRKALVKQSAAHNPFRCMLFIACSGKESYPVETITIHDNERNYTAGFIALLKDYYQKL